MPSSWKCIITNLKIQDIHLNFIIKSIINCFQDIIFELSQGRSFVTFMLQLQDFLFF